MYPCSWSGVLGMDDWSHNHLLPESPLYPFARVPAITPGIREEPIESAVRSGHRVHAWRIVETMEQFSNDGRPRRREYSKAFKAQVVAACAQPGASVGGVALSQGLHANMVHRWIREAGPVRAQPGVCSDAEPGFISLPLTAMADSTHEEQALAALPPSAPLPPPSASVHVRLQRGELVVSLQCPLGQCGALLREVLR